MLEIKAGAKLNLIYQNDKVFGKGPYDLLREIERVGSLKKASENLNICYSKAFKIIKNVEKKLNLKLTVKKIGGKGGGGSSLTKEAYQLIKLYETLVNDVDCYLITRLDELLKEL